MFVYYYGHVRGDLAEVEHLILDLVRDRPEIAELAYREAEELRARVGPPGLAKTVRLEVGEPIPGRGDTRIPISWVAAGARRLFPRLDGELVLSKLGHELSQVVFRGTYDPPLGPLGEVLDRVLLHRLAEATVKRFVDVLLSNVADRLPQDAAVVAGGE